MTDRPACGKQCSACFSCPDLGPLPNTERETELYMRGFEDGKKFGEGTQQIRDQAERLALAAHWAEHAE